MKTLPLALFVCAAIVSTLAQTPAPPPSGCTPGPPNYACSTTSYTAGTISTIFNASAPTPTQCAGDCQNTVRYDTTINPSGIDAITRITDGRTVKSGGLGGSVGDMTCSAGANDPNISTNGTDWYFAPVAGGVGYIYHLTINGSNQIQVVNSGVVPAVSLPCPFVMSRLQSSPTTGYYLTGSQLMSETWSTDASSFRTSPIIDFAAFCPGLAGTGFVAQGTSQLNMDITETLFTTSLSKIGGGQQGTATWLVAYSTTKGCATANLVTGDYWNYCASSCSGKPKTGTLSTSNSSCWGIPYYTGTVTVSNGTNVTLTSLPSQVQGGNGFLPPSPPYPTFTKVGKIYFSSDTHQYGIASVTDATHLVLSGSGAPNGAGLTFFVVNGIHNAQMTLDGTAWVPSFGSNGGWVEGLCTQQTGEPAFTTQYSFVNIGGAVSSWAYNGSYNNNEGGYDFGAHESIGVYHSVSPFYAGPNIRSNGNLNFPTPFFPPFTTYQLNDTHFAWPHPLGDDSYPWVGASDWVFQSARAPNCSSSAVYCPSFLNNVVQAWYPMFNDKAATIFFHTYSCGANPNAVCTSGPDAYFGSQYSIGSVDPPGKIFCWASTMLGSLGNDNLGNPRADAFCGMLE